MGEHRRREQGVAERELPQLLDHLVGEGLAEHRFGELRRRRPVERRHVDVTAEVLVPEQGDGCVDDRHVAVRGDQDRGAGSDELRDERRRGSVEQVHVVEPEHEPSSADAFGDRLAGGNDHRHALAGDRVGEQRHEDTEGSAGAGGAAAEEGRRMAAPRQLEHDLLDEPALAVAGDAVEHGADPVLGIADGGSEQPVASHEWRAGAGAGEPQRLGVDRGGGFDRRDRGGVSRGGSRRRVVVEQHAFGQREHVPVLGTPDRIVGQRPPESSDGLMQRRHRIARRRVSPDPLDQLAGRDLAGVVGEQRVEQS